MADQPSINEEQMVLFRDHIALQKEELAAKQEQSRADEKVEMQRLATEAEMHKLNLMHAGRVLDAQALDRRETRNFWDGSLRYGFYLIGSMVLCIAAVMVISLFLGAVTQVIDLIKTLGSYAVAILAGAGADRAWIHRKRSGISNTDEK